LTHAACTPLDMVKTRLQTSPGVYEGPAAAFRTIVKEEGPGALLKGLGATASGYFMHGAFKYSFYEVFKLILAESPAVAVMKPPLYVSMMAGFLAECIACVLLTPMEAIRIRSVADQSFPIGVAEGLAFLYKVEGFHGLYKGMPSVLLKQVPYTVGQFVSFEFFLILVKRMAELASPGQDKISSTTAAAISMTAGLMAGIVAGVISQPGDTILSKLNQQESEGPVLHQMLVIARALGPKGLFLGLSTRLIQVSCMIGGQFLIYDSVKILCGIQPASAVPSAVANAVAQSHSTSVR